ncbi:hypothetical protein SAMN04487939_10836 [Lysobacter sp. yr284]|uniref:XVIPCD domain-containing protein n=1 Tax=Lysobacter sp. yr284 TaxID=1761791 RepID=UPI000899A69C|nr:XVIPCD domain-containing protein [Lysobacter sp. yr284]SDY89760.1 hypothetical protein SAMN04487939_10836 [Lysobacter sp. yr284]
MPVAVDPRVEAMLARFDKTQSPTDAESAAMRRAISESPYLAQLIETGLGRGVIQAFTAQSVAGSGAHFDDRGGELNVSRATLRAAAANPGEMDGLVGALAHEAAHAANQDDRVFRHRQFERDLAVRFQSDAQVHDPTEIALRLQQRQRWDEAYAELHSVNAVVSRIRHLDPGADDQQVLRRAADTTLCIEQNPNTGEYGWVGGIRPNPDNGRIAYTPDNLEAVALCHFDARADAVRLGTHRDLDYRNYYAAHTMGRIADLKIAADNLTENPLSAPDAPMHLDLGRLGWDLRKIEREGVSFANHKVDFNFYDTTSAKPVMRNLRDAGSLGRQDAVSPDIEPPALAVKRASGPGSPEHADHSLYLQARQGVIALNAQRGRAWDDASERLAASLTALGREQGLSHIDHVVLSGKSGDAEAGENVFVVEGRLDDPAHRRAHMKTAMATETAVEVSFERLALFDRSQQTPHQAQAIDTHEPSVAKIGPR